MKSVRQRHAPHDKHSYAKLTVTGWEGAGGWVKTVKELRSTSVSHETVTGLVGGLLPKSGGRLGTAPHAEINIR